jgi:hypothetical protein
MMNKHKLISLKEFSHFSISFSFRLHHDQQTAHALESAAAYSNYPTMAGMHAM